MCRIKAKETKLEGENYDLELTCSISGKPISVTNEYGMFCEDMCDLEENKKAAKVLQKFLEPLEKFATFLEKMSKRKTNKN